MRDTILQALKRRSVQSASVAAFAAVASFGLLPRDGYVAPAATRVVATVAGDAGIVSAGMDMTPAEARRPSGTPGTGATGGLPNIEHQRVQDWIKRFTTTQRGSMITYLRRKERYEPMISSKLAARDMPQGLIYLAMIESGFNPTAKSPVKASGLWQFMSATAREYGLTVSRKVDERNNPARSTDAALKYLDRLHDRFGSWYLAAAAYNTGQGRVARVLKQVTGKTRGTDADYYRIASRLPRETRDYVPKMIAAARIGTNPARYGFSAD